MEAKRSARSRGQHPGSNGQTLEEENDTAISIIAVANDFCEHDLEAGEFIPTISLTTQAEVGYDSQSKAAEAGSRKGDKHQRKMNKIYINDDQSKKKPKDSMLYKPAAAKRLPKSSKSRCLRNLQPSAVALPVGSLMSRDEDASYLQNNIGSTGSNHTPQQRQQNRQRSEFISASLRKTSVDADLGISFREAHDGTGFTISELSREGLIGTSNAPFQVGDTVISINSCSCDRMDHPSKAATLLQTAPVEITLVVRNSGGDPLQIETMITKPSPRYPVGIGFSCLDSLEQVNVSCILEDGLFAQSLLTVGDEIVSINGITCRGLDSDAVADIVRSAPDYVTIIAKKFLGNGVVLATGDDDDHNAITYRMIKWLGMDHKSTRNVTQYGRRGRLRRTGYPVLCCCTFMTALVLLILYLQVK